MSCPENPRENLYLVHCTLLEPLTFPNRRSLSSSPQAAASGKSFSRSHLWLVCLLPSPSAKRTQNCFVPTQVHSRVMEHLNLNAVCNLKVLQACNLSCSPVLRISTWEAEEHLPAYDSVCLEELLISRVMMTDESHGYDPGTEARLLTILRTLCSMEGDKYGRV